MLLMHTKMSTHVLKIEDIQLLRENVDQESDVILKQAVRMANDRST